MRDTVEANVKKLLIMDDKEEEKSPERELLGRVDKAQGVFQDLREMPTRKFIKGNGEPTTVREFIETVGKKEDVDLFDDNIHFVHRYSSKLNKLRDVSDVMARWQDGDMEPDRFISNMSLHLSASEFPDHEAIISSLKTYAREHFSEFQQWNTLNESSKLVIIADLNRIAHFNDIRTIVSERLDEYAAGTEQYRDAIEAMITAARLDKGTEKESHGGGFFKDLGIMFVSPLECWEAFKKVKDAYKHAWHERFELKVNILADKVGKAIPDNSYMAGSVKLNLEKGIDSANQKVTNEFKEFLEKGNFTFEQLFIEHHGPAALHHNLAEPNNARAILEYAAGRGWLYDINDFDAEGARTICGYSIDEALQDWGNDENKKKNYIIDLRGQNSKGRDKEISDGKSREYTTNAAPKFIKAINREMDAKNYWAAVGIAQRAIDRGLAGEISPWIATTVMRYLREDPVTRKFMNIDIIDEFGKICLGHSSRTLAYLKFDRHKLNAWKQKDEPLEKADSMMGNIQLRIEHEIKTKSGKNFETKEEKIELDHMVAQVLAAQIVLVKPGVYVNVFEPSLVSYVASISNQGNSSIKDEDDDYFRNVSDVILADPDVYKRILDVTGSGQFSNGDKATNFINTILELRDEMKKKGLVVAAQNLENITKDKLKKWLTQWIRESRGGPVFNAMMPDQRCPVIYRLIQEELIDYQFVEDSCTQIVDGSPLLAQSLIEQLAKVSDIGGFTNKYQKQAIEHIRRLKDKKNNPTPKGKDLDSPSANALNPATIAA
jgi:hypothetical protein